MLFVYCFTVNIYGRKKPSDQEHRPEEVRNFTVKAKEDEGSNKSLFIYLFIYLFYVLTDSFTSSGKQNPLRSLVSDEAFIAERKN